MLKLDLLKYEDCKKVIEWNSNMDAAFLEQWAGPGYTYPITDDQIFIKLDNGANSEDSTVFIYKIVLDDSGEMIGTVELCDIDRNNKSAKVARYLIGDAFRGKGYGEMALKQLVQFGFDELGLEKIILNVFDYNVGAIECYKKVGFTIISHEYREKPTGRVGLFRMMIEK